MLDTIVGGLLSLGGVIIGWLISWRMHMRLRAEKFKEITYKEQLAVYKELAERIGEIYATSLDCASKSKEPMQLIDKTVDYNLFLIRKGFLIPQPLYDESTNFSFSCAKLFMPEIIPELYEQSPPPMPIEDKVKLIGEAYIRIQNLLRHQFQTDHITKAIQTTINPEYKPFENTSPQETTNEKTKHKQKKPKNFI